MNSRSPPRVRAMFWNPQKPALLSLPQVDKDGAVTLEHFEADPGIGCNEHEINGLMKIVTAHEDFMRTKQEQIKQKSFLGRSRREAEQSLQSCLKQLSTQYREAVRDCLSDWQLAIEKKEMSDEENNEDYESSSFELLRIVYSIMHISDIFLPLLPSALGWDSHTDPYQKPGIVTAATVRYLRYHQLDDAADMVRDCGPDEIEEMLDSAHPEEFGGGEIYWDYVRQLVLRGCLENAWSVISKHSLYAVASAVSHDKSAYDKDPHDFNEMSRIYQGFLQLKEILMCAPLPGGRSDKYDDALESEEKFDDDVQEALSIEVDVLPGDYKFWESSNASYDLGATSDFPVIYNEKSASQKHRKWKEYVQDFRHYFSLSQNIPQIDGILAILTGDFQDIEFNTWAQKLCAELLYRNPDARPIQIHNQAQRIVEEFIVSEDEESSHVDAILKIMEGNAGLAILTMYSYGGAAGAALPATLMSLLYNLFVESGILPQEMSHRKTEFLGVAASAITSTLADSDPDIGVQLAVRLVIPYSIEEKNTEAVAIIANILEHYSPKNDQYADTLISHMIPLVERKSLQSLDACVSFLLCLHRQYLAEGNVVRATRALLRGIDLESKILGTPSLGSCYRTLAAECHRITLLLLQALVGLANMDRLALEVAKAMASSFDEHHLDTSNFPEAAELVFGLDIFQEYLSDNCNQQVVGNGIVACLGRFVDSDGVLRNQAPMSLYFPLIKLACEMIEGYVLDNSNVTGQVEAESTAAFDKNGITLLCDRLAQLSEFGLIQEDEVFTMRQTLAKGLSQAFIAENAQKKRREAAHPLKQNNIDDIRSMHLDMYDISTQERVIQRMLDF